MSIQTKEIAILPDVDVELLEAAQSMCYKTGRLRYWYAPAYALILNTGLRSGEEIPPMPPAVSRLSPLQNHALALGRFHLTITL